MINTRKSNTYWDPSRKGFVTNYPNFLHWKPLEADELVNKNPLNIYMHSPFCIQRCSYCYYKTINLRGTDKSKRIDRYVEALCREIELVVPYYHLENRPIASVYFGGGTPSLLNEEQLHKVISTLRKHLNIGDAEFTVEAEPVTLTEGKASVLRDLKVNRISMGVQSFVDDIIKQSNRLDDEKKAFRAIEIAKTVGSTVNIDLMSALAGETDETWSYTIARALETGVQSLTVYKTELYANTPYYKEVRMQNLELPSDEQELKFMQYAFDQIRDAGYEPWSFYTFTKGGQHEHVYATSTFLGEDCYSFGVSSFGRLGNYLFQNTNDEEKYISTVMEGNIPITRGHHLSYLDDMIRHVVLSLKLVKFDLVRFQSKYGFRLEALCAKTLEQLETEGYIEIDDQEIRLTNKGILHGDYVGKSVAGSLADMY